MQEGLFVGEHVKRSAPGHSMDTAVDVSCERLARLDQLAPTAIATSTRRACRSEGTSGDFSVPRIPRSPQLTLHPSSQAALSEPYGSTSRSIRQFSGQIRCGDQEPASGLQQLERRAGRWRVRAFAMVVRVGDADRVVTLLGGVPSRLQRVCNSTGLSLRLAAMAKARWS